MKTLSIIITVMNEEDNIAPLFAAIKKELSNIDFEVIIVDDGSTDGTIPQIKEHGDDRFKLVELTKNYGQSTALAAGIDNADGKYLVTMDGDLQNDPSDIPFLLDKIESENWDMVAGNRKDRQDNALRKLPSRIANFIIRSSTKVRIKDYGCTLKIFKSQFAKDLGLYGELHRFIPALAFLQGARITQVDVKHHPRKFGKSKYGLGRTFRVVSDLILIVFFQKYMAKPMHLFGTWGFLIFLTGVIINLYLGFLKILGHDIWGKPLLILGLLCTFIGIQFITIGIFAELLMRTYYESQNKKPYKIRDIYVGKELVEVPS